jgi:toxin FitB
MILLDTNVLSEVMRPQPEAAVMRWIDYQNLETLFISSITVAEQLYGIGSMPLGRRKDRLVGAVEGMIAAFEQRILPFDFKAARCYSGLAVEARQSGKGFPAPDGYIAAIAVAQGFAVATRDASAFIAAGVAVIDPWTFRT